MSLRSSLFHRWNRIVIFHLVIQAFQLIWNHTAFAQMSSQPFFCSISVRCQAPTVCLVSIMAFLYLFSTAAVAWVAWTLVSLLVNYLAARKLTLPIIISPLNALNPLWMLVQKLFPVLITILPKLPFGLGKWARCTYMGWTFQDKYALHVELGLVFVLVTPSGNELWVADPDVAHMVFAKRKEYHKPTAMYSKYELKNGEHSLIGALQSHWMSSVPA